MISQILNFDDYNGGPLQSRHGTGIRSRTPNLCQPPHSITIVCRHSPPALEPFLAEVEQFALGDYIERTAAGLGSCERQKGGLSPKSFTPTQACPVALWLKADLRLPSSVFEGSLLADNMTTTSQLDARYSGASLNPLSSSSDYDPLLNTTEPALMATFYPYARPRSSLCRRPDLS